MSSRPAAAPAPSGGRSSKSATAGGSSQSGMDSSRARRRREKERKVSEHRARILRKQRADKTREELSRLHKHKDFIAPLEFDNTLPGVPVESKLLAFPFDDDFAYAYDCVNGVSTEPSTLYRLHAPLDLDLRIDIANPAAYRSLPVEEREPLHPEDAYICSEEFARPHTRTHGAATSQNFAWLNRSALMHLDLNNNVYKHADPRALAAEALEAKQRALERTFAGPRRERIDGAFAAVNGDAPLVHPTNKMLTPRRVWDVLPDVNRWGVPLVQVSFDAPPLPEDAPGADDTLAGALKRARVEHGILRTSADRRVNVSEGTSLVHYMVPDADAAAAMAAWDAARDTDAEPVLLRAVRDYHMVVEKPTEKSSAEESFVMLWYDDEAVVRLVPIRARAQLTAVQLRGSGQPSVCTALGKRPASEEEQDALALAHADLTEPDASATRDAILARQRARQSSSTASTSGSTAGSKRPRDASSGAVIASDVADAEE